MPFDGPVIPFGAMVQYHPISAEDLSRLHQFGPKVLPGIFLGYALYAEWIWKGDIMVAYIEELEEMDASELHARRLNAKDVLTPMKRWKFRMPSRRWKIKIFGWEQRLRKSTFTRELLERGEEQEILWGKSNGLSSPNPLHEDSTRDDEGAKSDFWTVTGDFNFAPSRWTQSRTVRAERRIISYSVEVHRRYQNDKNITGRIVGEKYWRLLASGWRKRIVRCMDRLHKIYFKHCRRGLFQHSAGDFEGSKSTSCGLLCKFGSRVCAN